jgi:predicted dehydrogenase
VTGSGPVGVAVIGAGVISDAYLKNLTAFADVNVLGIADIDVPRAKAAAEKYGVPSSGDVDTVLANPDVELVVNLTIPAAHVSVATAAIKAGKHIYGEKPLTLERDAGQSLLQQAAAAGLRIGNAPDTFLGAGLQSTQRLIASGAIGEPLSALTAMQTPGPESWHPSPEFLFQYGAGPLWDIGPYYLTSLVQMFGPVSRVAAAGRKGKAERVIGSGPKAGTTFAVEVPTHTTALIEFEAGQVSTTVLSFDSPLQRHGFVEITGSEATLRAPDPNNFDGVIRIRKLGADDWEEVQSEGTTVGRGLGVLEMARALRSGAPHRASGELAFHVVDAMSSIGESGERGEFVTVASSCASPEPLPIDWDPAAATL